MIKELFCPNHDLGAFSTWNRRDFEHQFLG